MSKATVARITAGHRTTPAPVNSQTPRSGPPPGRSGEVVTLRPLAFYDAVGKRLLHHAVVVHIEGSSYRMRQHADLLPPVPPPGPRPDAQPKRRGRPPKAAADAMQSA